MTMPIVWVIQEGRNDYAPAEEYGEVRFVTKADLTKFNDSQQNLEVTHDLKKFLTQYVVGVDYIIPAGNPMLVAMATMSLTSGTQHNFLKWDGRRAMYIPYTLKSI